MQNEYICVSIVTKIGNTHTTTSSINRDILGWYNFYSIYPISKELYNLIKDNGIE